MCRSLGSLVINKVVIRDTKERSEKDERRHLDSRSRDEENNDRD